MALKSVGSTLALLCLCLPMASLSAAPAHSAEHKVECPAEVPASALHAADAPAGWSSSLRGGLLLHAVDLSFGPPSEMAFLKPDTVPGKAMRGIDKWADLQVGRGVGGIWIACNYGGSDHVILGKRLDDKVTECSAKYGKDAQGGQLIDVRCKW